jgi:hypothetical protein
MSKIGLFYNKSMNEYHQLDGFLSSSQLKDLFNDPALFHAKNILKSIPKKEADYFDVGNAYHTAFMEPEKYNNEFIAFDGRRNGDKWKEFKKKHEDKTILGNKSALEVDTLLRGTLASKAACSFLDKSKFEASVYVKLNGFPVKVRFDILQLHLQRAADPKSITGMLIGEKGKYVCQKRISDLDYDLSAALYLDAYNELARILRAQGKDFPELKEWFWIFASKDFEQCRTFKATKLMIQNGRAKYQLAIERFKEYEAKNWKMEVFEDRIEDIDPLKSDIILPGFETEKQW